MFGRLRSFILLEAVLLATYTGPDAAAASTTPPLPPDFKQFAAADVLHELPNKPGQIEWVESRSVSWAGERYLVVLLDTAPNKDYGFCGVCRKQTLLTLFRTRSTQLLLIASGSFDYTGHRTTSLSPVTYPLDDRESLIGVQIAHVWYMGRGLDSSLRLFRVVKSRLEQVLRITTLEYRYPSDHKHVIQVSSTLKMERWPFEPAYNVAEVTTRYARCSWDESEWIKMVDLDMCAGKPPEALWTEGSNFTFDGKKFEGIAADDNGGN